MLNIELIAVPSPLTATLTALKKGREPTKMLEGKAVVGETDMPQVMQAHAMRVASEALDLHEISDCKDIACHIKKVGSFYRLVVVIDYLVLINLLCPRQ